MDGEFSAEIKSLAYIAGFFDGEGSICIGKRGPKHAKHLQLTITLTQTDREILEWVDAQLGSLGRIRVKNHGRKTRALILDLGYNLKECYELVWDSLRAESVLTALLPYLKVKKARAEIALEFRGTFPTTREGHNRKAGISEGVFAVRTDCRERLMALN